MQTVVFISLWTLAKPAFKSDRLTGHVLEVRACDLNTDTSDIGNDVAIAADWRHVDVGFECFWIGFFKVFELAGPCKRADDVDVDVVFTPLGGCNTTHASDAFFCGCIGALSVVAKQTGTGSKVNKMRPTKVTNS